MAAASLYERHLEKLRSEENWADKPVEMFTSQARDELMKEGYRIDEADPLHALAIAGRAREIRDCLAELSTYVDVVHAARVKAKGGRPPIDVRKTFILIAAFEYVGSIKTYTSNEARCVEGSTRTRAAGSSGTAQALSGKFEPSLTAGSIASRVRSVKRGVLSVHVALIDGAATWLRGRSAKVQSRAIDTLASSVANNPGLAADLLEKFNPADFAAKRRMITQKYGVRATQLLNLIDESRFEDVTVDAAMGDRAN